MLRIKPLVLNLPTQEGAHRGAWRSFGWLVRPKLGQNKKSIACSTPLAQGFECRLHKPAPFTARTKPKEPPGVVTPHVAGRPLVGLLTAHERVYFFWPVFLRRPPFPWLLLLLLLLPPSAWLRLAAAYRRLETFALRLLVVAAILLRCRMIRAATLPRPLARQRFTSSRRDRLFGRMPASRIRSYTWVVRARGIETSINANT